MTVRSIRWTRRALRRLDGIGAYIAKDDPAAAKAVTRIVAAIERLASQPALGRPGRLPGTRELVLADISYIIAYRVNGADIEILTIMRSAQRWPDEL
jgi:addiction module RelE/StbE family toxin